MSNDIKHALNQIWAVYNHLPGGHVVAIHFEDIRRGKKVGDRTEQILISAKSQLEGFKNSPQVSLNINGRVVAREMLVYDGADKGQLQDKPNAADIVLAWAKERGVQPILSPAEVLKTTGVSPEALGRIDTLEKDVKQIGTSLTEIMTLLKAGK